MKHYGLFKKNNLKLVGLKHWEAIEIMAEAEGFAKHNKCGYLRLNRPQE